MFQSDYNNSLMRTPDYVAFLTRDFYIEPVSLEEVAKPSSQSSGSTLQLKKGESKTIGDVTISFLRFDMSHEGKDAMSGTGGFTVGAVLEVKHGSSTEQLVPVSVYEGSQSTQRQVARTKDGALGVELVSMNIDSKAKGSSIEISITGVATQSQAAPQKSELLVIEASIKPFMSLVWAGSVLMIFGLALSLSTKFNGKSLSKT
jgi:cytochrome c-type biogenesis protein CcmF